MEQYIVGGWVRDSLLSSRGYPVTPSDKDWVVVGSTPEEMSSLGFLPVGQGFPVFLHPKTHEEYALARTEEKVSRGYKGFVFKADPSVTLEEDLLRRDLTINAIAMDRSGNLHDPYGGRRDLEQRVLRHVSSAFREDPVRLLRLARFSARFPDFSIAPETKAFAEAIVKSGEADALVPERIFKEISRALEERRPSNFFHVLRDCGFLPRLLPEVPVSSALLALLDKKSSPEARFAILLSQADEKDIENVCERLKAPKAYSELALLVRKFKESLRTSSPSAEEALAVLKGMDAPRKPERFRECLATAQALHDAVDADLWGTLAHSLKTVNTAEAIKGAQEKKEIPILLRRAQLNVLKEVLDKR